MRGALNELVNLSMMTSHHDDQSISQAAKFHRVLTGILLQHQRCFCIRKASRQMHAWRCHCLWLAKTENELGDQMGWVAESGVLEWTRPG